MINQLYYQYWGKASKEDNSYHLLPYHCLDVVAVADIWLQHSSVLLNQISQQIRLSKEQSKSIVLFFIALHDLGKFDARFQNFIPDLRIALQGEDHEVEEESYSHGSYGYYYFEKEFDDSDNMKAVAGHHGFYDESIRFMLPDAPITKMISGIECGTSPNALGLFSEIAQAEVICPDCTHVLNYNLHMNIKGECFGPTGATGIRGGGAISTLIAGKDLKTTILANTIAIDYFNNEREIKEPNNELMWQSPIQGDIYYRPSYWFRARIICFSLSYKFHCDRYSLYL